MRINRPSRTARFWRAVILLLPSTVVAQYAVAQNPISLPASPTDTSLGDGHARLERAERVNGLLGSEVSPWHLKLYLKYFDQSNQIKEQGTLEVYWVNSSRFKTVYTSSSSSAILYGTPQGIMRPKDQGESPSFLASFNRIYLDPISHGSSLAQLPVDVEHRRIDGSTLECLTQRSIAYIGSDVYPSPTITDCVDPHTSALRIKILEQGEYEDIFESPISFKGRFLPTDIRIQKRDHLLALSHLEKIESIDNVDEATITPPSDAVLLSNPNAIKVPDGIAQGLLIKKVEVIYPKKAKKARIEGTVIVHLVIDKDGLPHGVEGVSGPPELQKAVIEAVEQWRYKPYTLYGAPVEVDSTVTSVFKLNR
jgi:TonB family protein